jgi:hypothetical protein
MTPVIVMLPFNDYTIILRAPIPREALIVSLKRYFPAGGVRGRAGA